MWDFPRHKRVYKLYANIPFHRWPDSHKSGRTASTTKTQPTSSEAAKKCSPAKAAYQSATRQRAMKTKENGWKVGGKWMKGGVEVEVQHTEKPKTANELNDKGREKHRQPWGKGFITRRRTFNKRQQQTTTNRNWLQTKIPTLTIEAWLSGHWQEPGLGVPKSGRATGTGPEVHSFA